MAASSAPFALTRCTVDDMQEILELQYRCFPEEIRRVFMGCRSPADLPRLQDSYVNEMRENLHDIWIAVKDTETGKFVAVSNWRLYTNGEGGARDSDAPREWLDAEDFEKSRKIISHTNESRAKSMPGPFLHLHICFTDSEYRRRGAGGMMMQWGCDLADQLFLPGWIEASEEGNYLYKRFGFYDFEKIQGDLGGMNMKRDAKQTPVLGGKPKV